MPDTLPHYLLNVTYIMLRLVAQPGNVVHVLQPLRNLVQDRPRVDNHGSWPELIRAPRFEELFIWNFQFQPRLCAGGYTSRGIYDKLPRSMRRR